MGKAGMHFPPTPWNLINLIQVGSEEERRKALEAVCRTYWQPIYIHARLGGKNPEDAADLTQDLFRKLHETSLWDQVTREKGSLRSFLRGALRGAGSLGTGRYRILKKHSDRVFVRMMFHSERNGTSKARLIAELFRPIASHLEVH